MFEKGSGRLWDSQRSGRRNGARIAQTVPSACWQLVRWQVRAVRVYRVPLLRVDACGLPGRRRGARTVRPRLAGREEAGVLIDATGLVALAHSRDVRGYIRLRIRLSYPYVPHILFLLSPAAEEHAFT